MLFLPSWQRVNKKVLNFERKFGYNPDVPCIVTGPQEESDRVEYLVDKSLRENKDYLEIEFGWNADEIRAEIERTKYIFID